MMFRTDQLEYQPWTNSAGAKVVIHSNNEGPFPTSFGYTAAPGLVTSYAMKLVSFESSVLRKTISVIYYT